VYLTDGVEILVDAVFMTHTGSWKVMDLVSRRESYCEKRNIEMGFAVTCLSTHKIFLNTHEHVVLRTFCAHSMRICDILSAVVSTATVITMATVQEEAHCVIWMAKSKSLNLMLNAIDEDDNRYGE
jgi:hypothetical protein